ncbi:MAG: clostripain-related cysteine peptidase [Aridibacter sp.]
MKQKEWTIMVYMAGDNNLAVDMAYAMEQIREVAGKEGSNLNLFVYYDGNSPSIPTLYCDFSDKDNPKYVSSQNVPDKLYRVPSKTNENAADKRSVLNFVDWCINKVNGKANRYALIFSGHSLGFQDIGLFKDEGSGKTMKMTDLFLLLQRLVLTKDQLVEEAKNLGYEGELLQRETTEIMGRKLDLLGFDSCVMGMIEVGYQFDAVSETMVVSEGSIPSAGWTYAKILGGLARGEHHDSSAQTVAKHFVSEFIRSQDQFTVGGVSVDMAAWDMSQMWFLTNAFNELAGSLIDCFKDENSRIYKQMERAVLHAHWKCQSYMYDQNIDLGDFCELLDQECDLIKEALSSENVALLEEVQTKCQKVITELKKAVILSGYSGGGYQYSNGVSVFFPWSWEGYQVSQQSYESLLIALEAKLEKNSSWVGFLQKYLLDVARRKSTPPTPADAMPGSKFRYRSGIRFDENLDSLQQSVSADEAANKLAGQQNSKIAGQQNSKLAGQQNSKIAGQQDSKIAGQQNSKLAGQQNSKLSGQQDSKLAGQQNSKIAGQQNSKLSGQQNSKLAGQQSSKMDSGGSNTFFDNLKLFKNIESPWNISGLSKKPDEQEDESENVNKGRAGSA